MPHYSNHSEGSFIKDFEWTYQGINVDNLEVEWDIYSCSMTPEQVETVNRALTVAAKATLESRDWKYWSLACLMFGEYGAYDTEPQAQMRQLWSWAYSDIDEDCDDVQCVTVLTHILCLASLDDG